MGAAARLYADAFVADAHLAEDLRPGPCHEAARAAALTGCRLGADGAKLEEAERTRWRWQARNWLRADLAAWAETLDNNSTVTRALVRETVAHWQVDPDLAGLRESSAMAHLPADERTVCLALWQAVGNLLRRAREAR
jgi:hypothetical protein